MAANAGVVKAIVSFYRIDNQIYRNKDLYPFTHVCLPLLRSTFQYFEGKL